MIIHERYDQYTMCIDIYAREIDDDLTAYDSNRRNALLTFTLVVSCFTLAHDRNALYVSSNDLSKCACGEVLKFHFLLSLLLDVFAFSINVFSNSSCC